ncbi:hypothetical protein ACFQ9J_21335 [Streptomyces sp. NPDC056529]|uniref:hypothetical protein n=1 Tax=Streptomyces sp. NPDC056529 TaxID=3345855 RepID=UPI0036B5AE3A
MRKDLAELVAADTLFGRDQAAARLRVRRAEFGWTVSREENRAAERAEPEVVGDAEWRRDPLPCRGEIVNKWSVVLKQAWIDWAVLICMIVTAARCRSPFTMVLFTGAALAVAVIAARKTWQVLRTLQERGGA